MISHSRSVTLVELLILAGCCTPYQETKWILYPVALDCVPSLSAIALHSNSLRAHTKWLDRVVPLITFPQYPTLNQWIGKFNVARAVETKRVGGDSVMRLVRWNPATLPNLVLLHNEDLNAVGYLLARLFHSIFLPVPDVRNSKGFTAFFLRKG